MKARVDIGMNAPRLQFGAFVLDMGRAELSRAGQPMALRPKALALLGLLASRAGHAVSKEELLAAVWPGVVVGDDSLTQCVAEVRTALGDRGGQSFIHTLPRLGYRFDMPVQALPNEAQVVAAAGFPGPALAAPDTASVAAKVVSSRWPRYAAAAGIVLATLATTATLLPAWQGRSPFQRIDAELAARRSIAVMPFVDRSATPAPHVAEAVVEEILTDVARMRDSLVISSGSTRALAARGQTDPVQVGRELGVQFVLTGSLQRDAERLQLHVQLARAAGGAVLWSERFDNAGASGQNWQREVSGRIAGALDVKMHDGAIDPLWHVGRNSEAMDQWMRGAYLMRRFKTRKEVLRAREHFEAALAAEPRSVSALIGLAQTHQAEVFRRWHLGRDKAESLGRAKEYALAALSIDSNHAGALVTLGAVQTFANDFEEAERTLTKALILNPNNARVHSVLAALKFFMGRWTEVEAHIVSALRLNPLESENVWACHLMLGDSLMHLGQDRAREHHLLAVLAEPTLPNPHFSMASHAALRGRIEEAKMHLSEAQRLSPGASIARSLAGDRSQHPDYLASRRVYREGLRLAGLPEYLPDSVTLRSGTGSP